MIKPGTLCMIRGVPAGRLGYEFNGNIITAGGIKGINPDGSKVRFIEPALYIGYHRFTGCREQWLFPFEDFDPSELDVTDKELETA